MPEPDLLELFVAPLEAIGVRYLVTGSVASTLYGEPRATHDIDLVVDLGVDQLKALHGAFPEDEFYLPPPEVVRVEVEREGRGHFNVIHHRSGLKGDFYLLGQDEFHAWAFEHARSYRVGAHQISLAPAEYVITRKLEFYREGGSPKHLRDIRAMLAISRSLVDLPTLEHWIEQRGLGASWSEV